ncbi:hypothetical protein Ahia01_000874600 [Argonauta hians]
MAKSISLLRPNRDYYREQIKWTYELNQRLYRAYVDSNPKCPGFTKRLLTLWKEEFPETQMTAKHLNEQAKRIIKKKLIYFDEETAPIPHQETSQNVNNKNMPSVMDAPETSTDEIPGGTTEVHRPTYHQRETSTNETPSGTTEVHRPTCHQHHGQSRTQRSSSSMSIEETEAYKEIYDTLKSIWDRQIEEISQNICAERKFSTRAKKQPTQLELQVIDDIALTHLNSVTDISYETINRLIYVAAISLLTHRGEQEQLNKTKRPKWTVNLNRKIKFLRRNISQIAVVIQCTKTKAYTKHQNNLKKKWTEQLGDSKVKIFESKLHQLKQELTAVTEKLRYRTRTQKRREINSLFSRDAKAVYRNFKEERIPLQKIPSEEQVYTFWNDIWGKERKYNRNAEWLRELEQKYCTQTEGSSYMIGNTVLENVLRKVPNGKSPGPDLITGFWYKNLVFYRKTLLTLYTRSFEGELEIPKWLSTATTLLIPKNKTTEEAKNYRPIACLNLMYKLYTGCLNYFLQDHCSNNEIITPEQAGGKKGTWGCTDQLLINKMVNDITTRKKRNLAMAWLDYQKAYDSVPHDWVIQALRLAKVPTKLVEAIQRLMKNWCTSIILRGENEIVKSNTIHYQNGIFQGDSLSVLLFVLALNPLSFLIREHSLNRNGNNISHLFYVDDLKLYAPDLDKIRKQLDLITKFSEDIGMRFGESKCAYVQIKRGKVVPSAEVLHINDLTVKQLPPSENYRYLGQDECLKYDGPINKERVRGEYLKRTKKIWSSEYIAHNTFAVPVLTPTFGLLNWSIQELDEIDIKTRKVLSITGNFNVNGDVDRLYTSRKEGGRGLRSVKMTYETRIVALRQHLQKTKDSCEFMA